MTPFFCRNAQSVIAWTISKPSFWAISRAPLPRLLAYRERMGWTFPWASAAGTDFNADYGVGITEPTTGFYLDIGHIF